MSPKWWKCYRGGGGEEYSSFLSLIHFKVENRRPGFKGWRTSPFCYYDCFRFPFISHTQSFLCTVLYQYFDLSPGATYGIFIIWLKRAPDGPPPPPPYAEAAKPAAAVHSPLIRLPVHNPRHGEEYVFWIKKCNIQIRSRNERNKKYK